MLTLQEYLDELAVRAAKGAVLMDEKNTPGWYWQVKVEQLQMRNRARCVLGQAHGDYSLGLRKLELTVEDSVAYGFNALHSEAAETVEDWDDAVWPQVWDTLGAAWHQEITRRREDDAACCGL